MRYLDTGSRDAANSLAEWFRAAVLPDEIAETRIQTGYFSLDGIGPLVPVLEQSAQQNRGVTILIGSNDAGTLGDDVTGLIHILGIPRNGAQLGVVSFGAGLFHPKTYHFRRHDGSQVAFVGSANLTPAGLALNVEAGIALDTRAGDDAQQLSDIASAIDEWLSPLRAGVTLIDGDDAIAALVTSGILALTPTPPAPNTNTAGAPGGTVRPRLRPLVTLPPFRLPPMQPTGATTQTSAHPGAPTTVAAPPVVQRTGFPDYVLFDPNAAAPTAGISALTGTPLAGGSVGLIVQLNRDSARHFVQGATGTANISIPVATLFTLRFGIYGIHNRPRAEFDLRVRYVSDARVIDGGTTKTNVMGYGFTAGEAGHGDIRMLVPAAVRALGQEVSDAALMVPVVGNFAFLEWPTLGDPSFRLSFLDPQSEIFQQAQQEFTTAGLAGGIVGNGACWLTAEVSPDWPAL